MVSLYPVAALLLLSLPLPFVIAALQVLEEPTGCGGIVEWGFDREMWATYEVS